MDGTKRGRLSLIWLGFAAAMLFYVFGNGFDASLEDLLGVLSAAFGVGLAVLYYFNPNDVLSFG